MGSKGPPRLLKSKLPVRNHEPYIIGRLRDFCSNNLEEVFKVYFVIIVGLNSI